MNATMYSKTGYPVEKIETAIPNDLLPSACLLMVSHRVILTKGQQHYTFHFPQGTQMYPLLPSASSGRSKIVLPDTFGLYYVDRPTSQLFFEANTVPTDIAAFLRTTKMRDVTHLAFFKRPEPGSEAYRLVKPGMVVPIIRKGIIPGMWPNPSYISLVVPCGLADRPVQLTILSDEVSLVPLHIQEQFSNDRKYDITSRRTGGTVLRCC